MFRRLIPLLAAGAICTVPAAAHQYELGTLVIGHPWSRPTAPGMPMGVAYLSITNNGKTADALIAASSPAAARVELHQTTIADGMARMRPLTEIAIAPGATVKIEPGGIHLMLVDLKAPLEPGKKVSLVLEFRVAGRITVELSVEARDAPPTAGNSMSQSHRSLLDLPGWRFPGRPDDHAQWAPQPTEPCPAQSGIFWPRVSMTQ